MEKLIEVGNLSVVINGHKILDDITFDIEKGDTVAVIGPNGAGKSVLLKALIGLIPYKGIIKIMKGVKIGYVPQRFTIEKDLPITTKDFFHQKNVNDEKALIGLKSVGFSISDNNFNRHVYNCKLGILSGGELQRVIVAWSLIDNPDILLFDEPTAGVDISSEETIYELLHKLQKKQKLSMLIVSHEIQIVNRYANKVICLNQKRLCYGPPHQVLNANTMEALFGSNVKIHEKHIFH